MAKGTLASMTDALKKELRAIGEDYKEVGRIAVYGKKKTRKRKSAAKRKRAAVKTSGGRRKAVARKATARKTGRKTKQRKAG